MMTTPLVTKGNKNFDWLTFSIYVILVGVGWSMVYSTNAASDLQDFSIFTSVYGKQILWIAISFVGIFSVLLIPFIFWRNFSFLIYFLSLLLLIGVLLFGAEVKGAQSWFRFAGFTFQPAEFAKLATALAVAAYTASTNFKITSRRALLTGVGLFIAPTLLVLLQPDAGSALVFMSFFILFYRLGLWQGYFIIVLSAFGLFILAIVFGPMMVATVLLLLGSVFLFYHMQLSTSIYLLIFATALISVAVIGHIHDLPWWSIGIQLTVFVAVAATILSKKKFRLIGLSIPIITAGVLFAFSSNFLINNLMEPHQRDRIHVWLQPSKSDPRGSLYNVIQSKVAIGSGGISGKGFTQGRMTKLNFVPEQSTDFIFCTIGEEQGFLGVCFVVILYSLLIGRIFLRSEQSRKGFIRNYGYIIGGILFIHFFINIGMTMGLVPIIGIPLPFLSYGGSSLIFFSLMLGIFLRLQLDDR